GGEIIRPSDGKHPKKIAWIQCVGSRQVLEGGNTYCSAVCCTYTQKHVLLAKEHDPDLDITVFHNDIRAYGKDFERYFQRASSLPKVRFIRSYVSIGREIPETNNVTIRYSTPDEGVKEEEFDLVVLSVGLTPSKDAKEIAEKFGIELESHGFCRTNLTCPIETTKKGIFVTGAFQGPIDIPESVFGASGASAKCGEMLNYRRGELVEEKVYPEEIDVKGEEPRVGVFVCHCGANIGRVVNVPEVVEYAKSLPYVVYAQEQLFSCTTNSAKEIADAIREKKLNRVVVAACSPRTLEPLFMETLKEAGLNQYLLEMTNIREHCSWVHSQEKDAATQKAKDIVRMAIARAVALQPLKEFDLPVDKRALVIGGGIAGMTCALSIANQGHEVYILEKEKELGGVARRLHYTLEGLDVQAYLKELIEKVYRHPLIHVYTGAEITEVSGYVGNFITKANTDKGAVEIKHGATVIAIGAEEYKPKEYLYGENENVLTQLELEELIAKGDDKLSNIQTVVMIQCVGCRNEDRNYCSRVCCSHAIKNALKLKEINPDMDIYILFRDMRTYGLKEDYYREAADKEVRFIRYEPPENVPNAQEVEEGGRKLIRVTVKDPILNQELAIDTDLLVLSAAVVPAKDAEKIALLYKVPLNEDGFFKEAHVKLRPVDFATEGVFLCGTAHYPKHINEVVNQAYGAAGRVITLLSKDVVVASGSVAEVDESKCMGCGACVEACAYDAIQLYTVKGAKKAKVNPVLCKGDGLCNAKCPTGAIQLKHYTDEEIEREIDAVLLGDEAIEEEKIVAAGGN
ncbi:MAG: heterodisulfide reductase, partial [Deltaproteobacteria bacterium]